jgi:hypothetical protein
MCRCVLIDTTLLACDVWMCALTHVRLIVLCGCMHIDTRSLACAVWMYAYQHTFACLCCVDVCVLHRLCVCAGLSGFNGPEIKDRICPHASVSPLDVCMRASRQTLACLFVFGRDNRVVVVEGRAGEALAGAGGR